ncbi:copper chaperone CopZ [Kribbella rubisoli]|uniref:Copper chaperone CopZ n=1 Tax=Kribbella rubisoli TaxID=3075929 RepID=A0A4Q7WKF9_9ACTN|nr:heavy-metal-associated domain-containing protein [Kribbella rubisoli]RZU10228.1 copper chaperone CopZ [Kribbella rubisoli]
MAGLPGGRYDRAAASRVLAEVAGRAAFGQVGLGGVRRLEPEVVPLDGQLSAPQLEYVDQRMRPCPPALVVSATSKVSWRDSGGVANVAHCGPLGPIVPVVAREATLAMWQALVGLDAAALTDDDRAVMDATTTDKDPVEILRVGIDTTSRALVQHAYLADQTPYRSAAEFARGLRDSGIFSVVANTWFWGLQSSTFRRGMIPVRLVAQDDGTVRYAAETVDVLREMKQTAIADAHERQYALLPAGEQPRCLANMSVDGVRLLPGVVDTFVETFVQLLELVEIGETGMDTADEVFEVPDMTCSHCTNTITGVLEALGVRVAGIDLDTKEVVAAFPSDEVRAQSFEAIRGHGYTVVRR